MKNQRDWANNANGLLEVVNWATERWSFTATQRRRSRAPGPTKSALVAASLFILIFSFLQHTTAPPVVPQKQLEEKKTNPTPLPSSNLPRNNSNNMSSPEDRRCYTASSFVISSESSSLPFSFFSLSPSFSKTDQDKQTNKQSTLGETLLDPTPEKSVSKRLHSSSSHQKRKRKKFSNEQKRFTFRPLLHRQVQQPEVRDACRQVHRQPRLGYQLHLVREHLQKEKEKKR